VTSRSVLILAGGRGERFWPWSRPERPKQLLPLARGGRTLLRATFERACRLAAPERILVMTAMDLREACAAECPGARILGEPVARNTTAAIAAAAAWIADDEAFAVLPADHAIDDESAFASDLERAFGVAEEQPVLITFGIRPSGPDTNFGYIQRGARLGDRLHRVARFTEKPDRARAIEWLAAGDHDWNSGIFVWRRRVFFDALEASRPAIAAPLRGLSRPASPEDFSRTLGRIFPGLESISVDYAVLEPATGTISAPGAHGRAGRHGTRAATCCSATRSRSIAMIAWWWVRVAPRRRPGCARWCWCTRAARRCAAG